LTTRSPIALTDHTVDVVRRFNTVAAGHDHPVLSFFPASARRLTDLLELQPRQRLLDVGAGTGAVALDAGQRLREGGSVVGVDIAPAMLEQARLKAAALGLANVEFDEMDAACVGFEDGTFDAVSCAFTVFFLKDIAAAISEWRRVLKPGGRLGLSVWGASAFEPMRGLLQERQCRFGLPIQPQQTLARTADPEICRELLRGAGFSDIMVRSEQHGRFLASAAEWWDVGRNMGFGAVLAQLPPARLETFKAEHLAEGEPLAIDRGIWLNAPVIFAIARK